MEKYFQVDYLPKGYLISNLGNVKSPYGRVLKKAISNSGYQFINIKNKGYFIHRAMCFAFIDKVEGKNYVNHKDGNKMNNVLNNLEWCTKSENCKHAYDIGLNNNIPLHYKGKFGIEHNRSIKIECNGVIYNGYSEASRKMKIGISTVHYRVNSNSKKWMHFQIRE